MVVAAEKASPAAQGVVGVNVARASSSSSSPEVELASIVADGGRGHDGDYSEISKEDIARTVECLLHPDDLENSVGGAAYQEHVPPLHIRESVLRSIEHSLHCTVSIVGLSCIIVLVDEQYLEYIASPPFLLAIVGVTGTAGTVGQGIVMSLGMIWSLLLSLVAITAFSLPFYCSPIAHSVVWFFFLWFMRYWLSWTGKVNLASVSAVYMLTALVSLLRTVDAETCDYTTWPKLLRVYAVFGLGTTACFIAAFIPYPRFNCTDAAQLNRRVLRDATRTIKASLSIMLLNGHRAAKRRERDRVNQQEEHLMAKAATTTLKKVVLSGVKKQDMQHADDTQPQTSASHETNGDYEEDDDDLRSKDSSGAGDSLPPADGGANGVGPTAAGAGQKSLDEQFDALDEAMVHHVHLLEQLRSHMDSDLTASAQAAGGAMFECGGCCCPAQPGSVLTPALSRDVRTVAHIAEGVARQVLTFNEDDDDFNMQGRQLENFGSFSGSLYFQYLQGRRHRQQNSVRKQGEHGLGYVDMSSAGTDDDHAHRGGEDEEDLLHEFRGGPRSPGSPSTVQHARTREERRLFKEVHEVAQPHIVRLLRFLDSPSVEARLHEGYFLTDEQAETAQSIFQAWAGDVTKRRGEVLMTQCGNVVRDFDILGYLSIGRMLFAVEAFLRRVSACEARERMRQGPGLRHIFCMALQGATCGSCGAAGGPPQERRNRFFRCGPENILFVKQAFSSTIAIYLAGLLTIVPELAGLNATSLSPTSSANSDLNSTASSSSLFLNQERYDLLLMNTLFAPLTVVFIADSNIGASFQVSILRFFGTVVGALFGSVVKLFLASTPAGTIVPLALWTFVCCLLQDDSRFGGAAKVGAYTAAMILFGDVNRPTQEDAFEVGAYALSVMVQTFIGVVVSLLCSSLIFPVNAFNQSVELLDSILEHLHEQHNSFFSLHEKVTEGRLREPSDSRHSSLQSAVVGDENQHHSSDVAPAPGELVAQLKLRSTKRDKLRKEVELHEDLCRQAQVEFAGCDRPSFHPEYLVAARFHLRRILQLHEILDAALFESMRRGQSGELDKARPILEGLRQAQDGVRDAVGEMIAFNAGHQKTNTLTNISDPKFRRSKQAALAESAFKSRAAILADERYLGILKRLIHERLRLQSVKEGTEVDNADCDGPGGEGADEIKELLSNAPPLPGPSLLLPLQVESMVQHKYVMAWKDLQDALDNVLMHLSRKPRYALPLYFR